MDINEAILRNAYASEGYPSDDKDFDLGDFANAIISFFR